MSWETDTLSNNAKVISGFAFKSDSFRTDKGVPIIKIKNIQREYVEIDGEYFVEDSFLSLDPKYHCVKSDILISLTGSHITLPNSVVGRVAKYHYDFTSLLNQRGGKIVVTNPKKLWNDYLYYFLCQNEIRIKLAQFGRGGANQCNISPSNVESITIILPPLQTQKRIASILSAYDDLIENNLKRIKLLEETAQNIYKEWFVNFRFPNYENTPISGETGLPEGWEVKTIDNIIEFKVDNRGRNPEYYTEKGIPVIDNFLLKDSIAVDLSNCKRYIDDQLFENFIRKHLKPDDVLITLVGNLGSISLAPQTKSVIIQNTIGLRCNNLGSQYFLFWFLKNSKEKIFNMNRGVAQPSVIIGDLLNMQIIVPNTNVINDFTLTIKSVFEMVNRLVVQNQKLKEARDILLPRLMNRTIEV